MKRNKPQTVLYRRKREGRTDYHKRLKLLVSRKPRLVVRFTNTQVIGQLTLFEAQGDKVIAAVNSQQLSKYGWPYSYKNLPAAYLAGFLLGKLGLEKGIQEAVLDTGLVVPMHKGKVYAFLRGVLEAGVKVPHLGEEILPEETRFKGVHIASYGTMVKENGVRQFAQYLKKNSKPEEIVTIFESVKKKIIR